MQLVINGQQKEFSDLPATANVSDLVTILGLKGDRVAIERNGELVSRASWIETPVQPNDKFEIVHFVGGGLR